MTLDMILIYFQNCLGDKTEPERSIVDMERGTIMVIQIFFQRDWVVALL